MSNEELAILIQEGKTEYCSQLWGQIERLLYKHLHGFKQKYEERIASCGLTDEDIMQEFYFALLEAVKAYDRTKEYKFTTYLRFHIRNCFFKLIGFTRKEDSLNSSVSLDNIVTDNQEDGSFVDLIEDETAEEDFLKVEDNLYNEELHKMLFEAIEDNLTPTEAKRLKAYYFGNKTLRTISKEEGCSRTAVDTSIKNGVEKLRLSPDAERIQKYRGFDLYNGNGFQAYVNRGCSSVEMIAESRRYCYKKSTPGVQ